MIDPSLPADAIDIDLTAGIPRWKRAALPIIVGSLAIMTIGAILVVLGALAIFTGAPGARPFSIRAIGGSLVFGGIGGWIFYTYRGGGISRLRVDGQGLRFTYASGSEKALAWSGSRFLADLYDVSSLPTTNSFVQEDPVWRYGLIVRAPFLLQCRFPREGYDAILAGARRYGLRVEPSPWRNFKSGEIAFRIEHSTGRGPRGSNHA
jgi:hypothetical protein